MANKKRRIYSTQRNPEAIALAKRGKQLGIISKQAKLHGGKYISQRTLKKVKEYQGAIRLGYRATPVTKARAQEARLAGFQVVQGNRIIRPKGARWAKRVVEGPIAGVRQLSPIRYLEVVRLPYDTMTFHQFIQTAMQNPRIIDDLKLPDELWAFKLYGNSSYNVFLSIKDVANQLTKYRNLDMGTVLGHIHAEDMDEKVQAFELIRVGEDAVHLAIPSPKDRDARNKARRGKRHRNLSENPFYQDYKVRVRRRNAIKAQQRRDKMSESEREEYRRKNRERMAKKRKEKK